MNVDQLSGIERIPLAIDYRRLYQATALLQVGDHVANAARIEFSLEMSPYGGQEVSVRFLDKPEYPLVPAVRILKDHIKTLDKDGTLP
jgi:hypothetical protein